MTISRTISALVLALLTAAPVFAAPVTSGKGKKVDSGVPYFRTIDNYLKPVTLTDDQKTKLADRKSEYKPKFKDAYANVNVLTPEQKTAADAAKKAALAEGKSPKDATAAATAAVSLTDDQKKALKSAKKALTALQKEFKGKVVALLTDDQKTQIAAATPAKSKKSAKPAAPAAPAAAPAVESK